MMADDTARGDIGLFGKASLVLSGTFIAIGIFSIGPLVARMSATFAHTSQAGLVLWVASIGSPAFALASPLAGYIVAKLGYRHVYLASILLFMLAGALPALSDDLRVVLVLRVILGIAVAGALTAALAGIGHLPEAKRPNLFGLQALFGSLSAVVAYPVVGLLAKSSWHLPFVVNLFGLAILPLALCLPRVPSAHDARRTTETVARQGLLAGVSPLLCLFAATVGVVMFSMQMVAGFYLISIGIPDPAKTAVPLTAMAIASMLAAGAYGFIHRALGTTATFASATAIVTLGLLICATAQALPLFTAGAILMGGGISICCTNLYTAASAHNKGASGPAFGVINGAIYVAPVLLPITMGPISAHLGAGGVFLVFAVIMLGSACLFGARWLSLQNRKKAVLF
jgi:MFS family permease